MDETEPTASGMRTHVDLTIIAQDQAVKGPDGGILRARARIPRVRLEPGPRSSRFHVVDYDTGTGALTDAAVLSYADDFAALSDAELLESSAFRAQQVYVVAARTLATFEFALGRRLSWGFPGHQLYLVPQAFPEANAYYSYETRGVLFGYLPGDAPDDVPTYTCLSHDVIAHETTHAILDGLRHRYLKPGLPDQAAVHEGIADIVALLSVFALPDVVATVLGVGDAPRLAATAVKADVLKRSVLTGVAEHLGQVLTHGRGALRQSALTDVPESWATDPDFDEPHLRGEVLVAAVIDALVNIWVGRLEALRARRPGERENHVDRERAAEEGSKAAEHLLTMVIRGLDYLPPVEFEMSDLITAILVADEQIVPDDDRRYRQSLTDAFCAKGILRRPDDVRISTEPPVELAGINFAALRSDKGEVFRFIWENADRLGIDTTVYTEVETVHPSQRVGPDGIVINESIATYVQMLDMSAREFAERAGMELPEDVDPDVGVQIFGGGTLVWDQFGRPILHFEKRLDDWDRQRRRFDYLNGNGIRDTSGRLGFSYGEPRGQTFARLHATEPFGGQRW